MCVICVEKMYCLYIYIYTYDTDGCYHVPIVWYVSMLQKVGFDIISSYFDLKLAIGNPNLVWSLKKVPPIPRDNKLPPKKNEKKKKKKMCMAFFGGAPFGLLNGD